MHAASERMQMIVATQSVSLVNQFSIDDLIVVEREDDLSVFKRLNESDFALWLKTTLSASCGRKTCSAEG